MGTKNKPGTFDCYGAAHPDEPMFILLARDPLAPDLVDRWADQREQSRGPSAKVEEARACAKAMREWSKSGAPKTMTILVNGVSKKVESNKHLSYDDVVALAGMTGQPSMTWKFYEDSGARVGGVMLPRTGSIAPLEGMLFTVTRTDNA